MRWLGLILRFVFRSFSRVIMGCFFTCFRVRDNRQLPTATAAATTTAAVSSRYNKPNDAVVPGNRLSSLFLSEEKEDNACDDGKDFDDRSQREARELRDEAKFLKACGTLASTPAEIRKASQKLKLSPSCDEDSGPPKFHSWLLDTSAERIQSNAQPFNSPTPTQQCQEWEKGMDSSDHTPSSCISNAQNTQWDSHDSEEGSREGSLRPSNRQNKSVRFECDTDISSCESSDYGRWHLKKTDSPNPTPMKLSDEMQTPGTAYPAKLKYLPNGKPLIKSQFVYPNSSQVEDVSVTKILEEEEYTPEKGLKKMSDENESKVEASLSSWLKPASVILEERSKRMENAYNQIRKTPADRPIIGLVATHWSEEEENSDVPPPKWWDGNGIPNSTNKYKEDQKVSWHATPFEERLEKALSEDTLISQRKDVCGKPIAFDENEESDTALSQLKPSTHSQSVMSF